MKNIDGKRLRQLLGRFSDLRIAVVGDFFLDSHFDCDPTLDERSLETGKTCYQVVRTRRQPGAAGLVAANLRALGVGSVEAVGFCGDDGEGYELRRAMRDIGLDLTGFFTCEDRCTPTYGKRFYLDPKGELKTVGQELERVDIKNRRTTPVSLQEQLIDYLRQCCSSWDGLIMLEQVKEANRGVLTSRVRKALIELTRRNNKLVTLADSRERIGLFKHVMIKLNEYDAARALGFNGKRISVAASRTNAAQLSRRTKRPVVLTMGARGILIANGDSLEHIRACKVEGPIDSVGAGDAVSAVLAASLASGSSLLEAATIATVAAAITVRQIGTTGTAPQAQLFSYFPI